MERLNNYISIFTLGGVYLFITLVKNYKNLELSDIYLCQINLLLKIISILPYKHSPSDLSRS